MLVEGVGGPIATLLERDNIVLAMKGGKKFDLPTASAQAMVGVGGITGFRGGWIINIQFNTRANFNGFLLIDGRTGQQKVARSFPFGSPNHVVEPGDKYECDATEWFKDRLEAGDRIELYDCVRRNIAPTPNAP